MKGKLDKLDKLKKWRVVSDRFARVYEEAQGAGVCSLLKGDEDLEGLIRLFFTPQGIEFCTGYNLPTMETLRLFRGMQAARAGFYIDAAPVKLRNAANVALFGDLTRAELEYDDVGVRHLVVVMHGAKVKIKASGYTVVFVYGDDVETEVLDKATVMKL
jgi:hypothetical protein